MPKRKTKTLKRKVKSRKVPAVKKNTKTDPKPTLPPVHSWSVCPYGEHWVKTHPMHVPSSKTHPEGLVTTRNEHCARNPSGKDQLYPEEIQEIAGQNFANLKNKPCPRPLISGVDGNQYDDLIAGWTQYWNEVLKPDESLDPNLNICAGIRWLFEKRRLLSSRLKKSATWGGNNLGLQSG